MIALNIFLRTRWPSMNIVVHSVWSQKNRYPFKKIAKEVLSLYIHLLVFYLTLPPRLSRLDMALDIMRS